MQSMFEKSWGCRSITQRNNLPGRFSSSPRTQLCTTLLAYTLHSLKEFKWHSVLPQNILLSSHSACSTLGLKLQLGIRKSVGSVGVRIWGLWLRLTCNWKKIHGNNFYVLIWYGLSNLPLGSYAIYPSILYGIYPEQWWLEYMSIYAVEGGLSCWKTQLFSWRIFCIHTYLPTYTVSGRKKSCHFSKA